MHVHEKDRGGLHNTAPFLLKDWSPIGTLCKYTSIWYYNDNRKTKLRFFMKNMDELNPSYILIIFEMEQQLFALAYNKLLH